MKDKALAIFGIGTYILGVITSATDLEGNFRFPAVLIMISGIATTVFIIMAIVRLWKNAKITSILLAFSTLALYMLSALQEFVQPSYGSPIIVLLNITKVINFLTFIYAVLLFWTMAKTKK